MGSRKDVAYLYAEIEIHKDGIKKLRKRVWLG